MSHEPNGAALPFARGGGEGPTNTEEQELNGKKDRNGRDINQVLMIAVYALGAVALMWTFINFVIIYFQ
jgi:hypothetical protein